MKRSAAEEQQPEDNFRKGFSDKLKQYQAAPDRDLWNRIELSLDKQEAGIYKKRYKVYSQLAAACLLLLLSAGGFLAYRQWNQPAGTTELATVNSGLEKGTASANKQATSPEQQPASPPLASARQQPDSPEPQAARPQKLATASPESAAVNMPEPAGSQAAERAPEKPQVVAKPGRSGVARPRPIIAAIPEQKPADQSPTKKPGTTSVAETPALAFNDNTRRQPAATEADPQVPEEKNARENAAKTTNSQPAVPAIFPEREDLATRRTEMGTEPTGQPGTKPDQAAVAAKAPKTDSAGMQMEPVVLAATDSAGINVKLPQEKHLSRWSIGALYAGQYFKQDLTLAGNVLPPPRIPNVGPGATPGTSQSLVNHNKAAIAEFNQDTGPAYSWQAGIEAGFAFNSNWKLLSGLRYTANQTVTKTTYQILPFRDTGLYPDEAAANGQPLLEAVLTRMAGSPDAFATEIPETKTYYRFHYLGLPLQLQYSCQLGQSWRSYVAIGGIVNRLAYSNLGVPGNFRIDSGITTSQTTTTGTGEAIKTWQFAALAGAGLGYQLAPQWQLQAGAELSWFAHGIFKEDQVSGLDQGNPLTLGARAGLSYTFSK